MNKKVRNNSIFQRLEATEDTKTPLRGEEGALATIMLESVESKTK